MEVKVKYFGLIADHLKKSEEELSIPTESAKDLKAFFKQLYPTLSKLTYQIAVDQQFTNEFTSNQVQEIALLPPFAGG